MAIPEGASSVHYALYAYSLTHGIEVSADFSVALPTDDVVKAAVHAAAEAGAEAMAVSLEAAFPQARVDRSRSYDCQVSGDPWPAPPAEEPAAAES